MPIHKVVDFLSAAEIEQLRQIIGSQDTGSPDKTLGRLQVPFHMYDVPTSIIQKVIQLSDSINKDELNLASSLYVKYSSEYGQPNLPPHYDADTCDLVIDYQLSANTKWDLGTDTEVHSLEDNSALVFNANEHIHWRPHKTFKDGEYVEMIFIRLYNPNDKKDYGHLRYSQNHPIFDAARNFRDSLNN